MCDSVDIIVADTALDPNIVASAEAADAEDEVACTAAGKTTSSVVATAVDAADGATPSRAAGNTALGALSDAADNEAGGNNRARPGLTSREGDWGGGHQ